ncbi:MULTISPECIES: ATP-dependent Clp protease proteolytic subunit [unclassified Lactobacillus]|uniref:ATP-dependent Clp protease proteolytic subunit n=1 Tax=unclassified Lactobacillus TaxID=2620435 RepID=UPI000EFD951C|nr:hypothetical protein F5ESL0247_02485 [Lactobacillus sp. ESL0247]RMC29112.1 hypothetical protein F5ESL0246_02485 [Lactobacillus sp. ESL0246]RMC32715.1 hypothetical protein F5ESL0245_02485 [Lactobacillus sp. ESL0245]
MVHFQLLILVAGERKFRALLPNTQLLIHQPIGYRVYEWTTKRYRNWCKPN